MVDSAVYLYTLSVLFVLGAMFGSFIDAMVWRLHAKKNFITDRSECEKCHHKLGVLDLVPVFSWLFLRGRCRYCKSHISYSVVLTEIVMAVLFVMSFVLWPYGFEVWQNYVSFAFWLVYLVLLGMLVVYDYRWMILPNKIVFPLIAVGVVDAVVHLSVQDNFSLMLVANHMAFGVAALAGLYWLLHYLSRGAWVGYGDVKLSVFIGVVLGWQGALLVLFLANFIGLLVLTPGLLLGRLNRKSKVPFGPFLILAFVIVGLFGDNIIDAYLTFTQINYLF